MRMNVTNVTLAGRAVASLRECVILCAAIGGAPACPDPTLDLSLFEDAAWLGLRRPEWTAGGAFSLCINGGTPSLSSAVMPRELDWESGYGACAVAYRGNIYEAPCDLHSPFTYLDRHCACTIPGNVHSAEIQWLDSWKAAEYCAVIELALRMTHSPVLISLPDCVLCTTPALLC